MYITKDKWLISFKKFNMNNYFFKNLKIININYLAI